MKIMFLRESEGVYRFNQSRIYVKVESGNRVLVKVGGGFMTVTEFIDKFQPIELEKVHRKNSIEGLAGRFQRKLSVQKINSELSSEMIESKPVNMPQLPDPEVTFDEKTEHNTAKFKQKKTNAFKNS